MTRRHAYLLVFSLIAGCGKTESPGPVALEVAPAGDKQEAPAKVEPKKEPIKKEAPKAETFDLRPYGIYALIKLPKGSRIETAPGKVLFVGDPEGAELQEGAVDLAALKREWSESTTLKLKALLIDEPTVLMAEMETAGKRSILVRVNIQIGGKAYHVGDYFRFAMVMPEQARRIVDWAQSIRQTSELKLAQEQHETALKNAVAAKVGLAWRGGRFNTPNSIVFASLPQVDARVCEWLQMVPGLESIAFLGAEQISLSGLSMLSELPKLRRLTIAGTGLNPAVVATVAGFKGLEALGLNGSPLSPTALRPLANLKDLVSLDLAGTRLNDNSLSLAQSFANLRLLRLDGTDVAGPGLALLKECKKLTILSLADTAITDAGIKSLLELPALTEVDLSETDISDAGLEALAAHPALHKVELRGASITADGLARLKKTLPDAPLFKTGQIDWRDAEEPAPATVVPPVPLDKLPPADPDALVTRLGGKLMRDDDAVGKPIVGIELHSAMLGDVDLGHLRDLKKLQTLNLEGCPGLTDAGLAYLAGCTALEELNLSTSRKIRGDGLAHLQGLTSLRKLLLPAQTRLTGPQLQFLTAMTDLESLTFAVAEPAYPKLRALIRKLGLKEVNLTQVSLSNHKLTVLKGLKNLEVIRLGMEGTLGDRGFLALKEFANLKTLIVPMYSGSNAGLEALRFLGNIESLELYGPFITDAGLSGLAACSKLEQVRLDRLKISDIGLGALRGLPKLLTLGLSETGVTDRGLGTIAELKDLEALDLSRTKVTDAGVARLKEMEELRILLLNSAAVTGGGFKGLEMKRLMHLGLNDTRVDDAGLAAIGHLTTNLRTLELARTEVTGAGLAALPSLRELADIDLEGCQRVRDNLVAPLKDLRSLKRVNLRNTKVSPTAIESLRQAKIEVDASGKR